ncbi:hypothetical protein SRABI128_02566 [Microbacterium sp. Bi128]|nr:hypothetical protein SRABI128_02566 [Microbacterium sp. Bi128]
MTAVSAARRTRVSWWELRCTRSVARRPPRNVPRPSPTGSAMSAYRSLAEAEYRNSVTARKVLAQRTRRRHSAPRKQLAVIATTRSAATGGAPVNGSSFSGRPARNAPSTTPTATPTTDVASPPPRKARSIRRGPIARSANTPTTRTAMRTTGSSARSSTVKRLRAISRTSNGPSPNETLRRTWRMLTRAITPASARVAFGGRNRPRIRHGPAEAGGTETVWFGGASRAGGGETTAVGDMGLRSGERHPARHAN